MCADWVTEEVTDCFQGKHCSFCSLSYFSFKKYCFGFVYKYKLLGSRKLRKIVAKDGERSLKRQGYVQSFVCVNESTVVQLLLELKTKSLDQNVNGLEFELSIM